ncbi:hypothetical protein H5410_004108 [Solanum commersonii]|uniref:Uncharacterized protein n=1 Tax=Solanum commersonii TaxID=4109 RepID=A0A9J6B7I9_SOLCO|nr:hypothetical protein H5410_004108 [Solanum commersonii]
MVVSLRQVWRTDSNITSSMSARSSLTIASCTSICSSLVSTSDSSSVASSLCISLVVAGGISEVSRVSKLSTAFSNEVKSIDFSRNVRDLPLPALTSLNSRGESVNRILKGGQCNTDGTLDYPWDGYLKSGSPHVSGMGQAEVEVLGACEGKKGTDIHKGPEVEVGKDASAGIESTSTSRDVSNKVALLLSASSRVYSISMHRKLVKKDEMTSISLVRSIGTPAHKHNSVISTGKGREVCLYLALVDISCSIMSLS